MKSSRRIVGRTRTRVANWVLPFALMLAFFPLAAGEARGQEVSPWEYTPYRVRIWLATDDSPNLPGSLAAEAARSIAERAEVAFGAAAAVEVRLAPFAARYSLSHHLGELEYAAIEALDGAGLKDAAGADLDKLFVLALGETVDGFVVEVREVDVRSRIVGPLTRRLEGNRDRLAQTSAESLWSALTPIAKVERTRGNSTAYVRVRAAGLSTIPDCPTNIAENALMRPVFRRNDRKGNPVEGGIFAPPWTYLLAEGRDRTLLECRIAAGVRTPLTGRISRRIDRFALVARPQSDTTRLVLQSTQTPPRPLVGYELYAKNLREPAPGEASEGGAESAGPPTGGAESAGPPTGGAESAGPPTGGAEPAGPPTGGAGNDEGDEGPKLTFLGLTDWEGAIEIPVGGDAPVRILYVKNGNLPLARLPCAPGVDRELSVVLPSDDLRLEAEGVVRGVQSSLVDIVCQRAVHAARIRKRISENKLDEAQTLLTELRAMPSRESFDVRLNNERARFRTSDRGAQKKIDELFKVTLELVATYLDASEVNRLTGELRKAREAQAKT